MHVGIFNRIPLNLLLKTIIFSFPRDQYIQLSYSSYGLQHNQVILVKKRCSVTRTTMNSSYH